MKSGLILLLLVTPWMAKIVTLEDSELRELLGADSSPATVRNLLNGWQNDSGAYNLSICLSPWGWIPGKNKGSTCWYSWGGKERTSRVKRIIRGSRTRRVGQSLRGCRNSGYQRNDRRKYWSAVVKGRHGWVPGKYSPAEKKAWYPWGGKEWSTKNRRNIWIVCK